MNVCVVVGTVIVLGILLMPKIWYVYFPPKDVITDSGSTGASGGQSTTNAQPGAPKRTSGGNGAGNNLSNVGSAVGSTGQKRSHGGGDLKRDGTSGSLESGAPAISNSGKDRPPKVTTANSDAGGGGSDTSPVGYDAKSNGGKTLYDYQMAPSPRSDARPTTSSSQPNSPQLSGGAVAPNDVSVTLNLGPSTASPATSAPAPTLAPAPVASQRKHKSAATALSMDLVPPPPPDRPASEEDILDEAAAPATEMSVRSSTK